MSSSVAKDVLVSASVDVLRVSVRREPLVLPPGTARLVAAASSVAVATLMAWALGAGIDLVTLGAFTLAPVMLFAATALGLRAQAIGWTAVVSGGAAAALVAGFNIPALAVAVVPAVVVAGFTLLVWRLPEARSVGASLIIGLFATLAAASWPVLAVIGSVHLIRGGFLVPSAVAVAAPLAAWFASSAGRSMTLSVGSVFAGLRDAVFRILICLASVAAAFWAGTALEAAMVAVTVGTPYESVAPTFGWLLITATLGVGTSIALWLPRWLAGAQLRGRVEPTAVGESLVFLTLASAAAVAIPRMEPGVAIGRASCVALAAGLAYTYCRVRYSAPSDRPNNSLWVVLRGEHLEAADRVACDVAGAWQAGQVTVLGVPDVAKQVGGEHLLAAARFRQGSALFPQRLVHLQDWDEAQPRMWKALPVRELYAPEDLWAKILVERLDKSAQVLFLLDQSPEEAPPVGAAISNAVTPSNIGAWLLRQFRRALPATSGRTTSDVVGMLIPRSHAPALRADMRRQELEAFATQVVTGDQAIVSLLRTLAPEPKPTIVRHMIVECALEDLPLAQEFVRRIRGQRDHADRLVECWISTTQRSGLEMLAVPLGLYRHYMILISRLLQTAAPAATVERVLVDLAGLFDRDWNGEFELIVFESDRETPAPRLSPNIVKAGLVNGTLARLVAVRSSAPVSLPLLTYSPQLYTGQVRLPSSRSNEVMAAYLADKLLAVDLVAVDQSAIVRSPLSAGTAATERHGRFLDAQVAIQIVANVAILLGALAPVVLQTQFSTGSEPTPSQRALEFRNAGRLDEAIVALTSALDTKSTSTDRVALLRDRAYCLKLEQQWASSIRDLSEAILLEGPTADREVFLDRAFAYLKIGDLDAAITDYQAATIRLVDDDNRRAVLLRTILSPINGTTFVFMPLGAFNTSEALPPALQWLRGGTNLRFWWHPILADEVRYTDPRDFDAASKLVVRLRESGVDIMFPTLMDQNVPRQRRIEVWLQKRNNTRVLSGRAAQKVDESPLGK
jgi:tetratricopeptide (TPR) repeat protein